MISVSFYTLGCKVNQLETEAVAAAFRDAGCTVLPWRHAPTSMAAPYRHDAPAVLCIINTCTVTSKAEQKGRRIIRLCLHSGCVVLVTGCYAQLEQKALSALGKNLFVLPGQIKDKLLDLPRYLTTAPGIACQQSGADRDSGADIPGNAEGLSALLERWLNDSTPQPQPPDGGILPRAASPFRFNPQQSAHHSRAFLKIQDGCDRACAYCRVPLARGKNISLAPQEALGRLKALENAGMAEAVLAGVSICQYRWAANPALNFSALLRFLLDNTSRIALRLSSLEPDFLASASEDVFTTLAHPRIRNHFHLSVQSGSDTVLAAMRRPYRGRDVYYAAEKLRSVRNDPFLACDIITGFPGETAADFEETAALCRTVDFAWIHAFPYSKRPGTAAAAIQSGLVSQDTARKRMAVLLALAQQGRGAYVRRWQGKTVADVCESHSSSAAAATATAVAAGTLSGNAARPPVSLPPGFVPALTDNYLKVLAALDSNANVPQPGAAFNCTIGSSNALPDGYDAWAQ